ncbi:hypothetical protein ACFW04_006615 [Cataglyphis niger]
MISEFDGMSRHKLQEFLNASILYTKLKGKAMQDFEIRDIQTFEELEHQLETCYQTKQIDLLAMKLYDSMIEGEEHPEHSKRTIHETIKKQALINFQIGFRDELKVLAMGACAEEKLLRPTKSNYLYNKNKFESSNSPSNRSSTPQCFKCGKNSHYGRDCRSRYALPKPEKFPRINTINKYCKYCKKSGHNREESKENNKKPNEKFPEVKRSPRQFKRNSESDSNSSTEEKDNPMKKTRLAAEYRVTHIKEAPRNRAKNELLVIIPMRQIKNKEIQMLYSGSTISLIKLKHLKDDTPFQEEKIALTGVTGHKIYTIGKMYGTIRINNQKVKHAFYVVRDDIPIEYEGILGIDFLRQHSVTCDYKYNQLKIGNAARTDQNRIGIVRAEEKAPGIYIGNCIVNAADYTCPVSIINTTDREVEMQTPFIALRNRERHDV